MRLAWCRALLCGWWVRGWMGWWQGRGGSRGGCSARGDLAVTRAGCPRAPARVGGGWRRPGGTALAGLRRARRLRSTSPVLGGSELAGPLGPAAGLRRVAGGGLRSARRVAPSSRAGSSAAHCKHHVGPGHDARHTPSGWLVARRGGVFGMPSVTPPADVAPTATRERAAALDERRDPWGTCDNPVAGSDRRTHHEDDREVDDRVAGEAGHRR